MIDYNEYAQYPAFPDADVSNEGAREGLSKRDYFSIRILQSLIQNADLRVLTNPEIIGNVTSVAILLADSLGAALEDKAQEDAVAYADQAMEEWRLFLEYEKRAADEGGTKS